MLLSRSTWLHLRILFSYFLLPVYLFALSLSPNLNEGRILWSFLILHLLLYPASNGYNSYFDKDEKSIGGLKNPPPVKKELYFTALALDGLAIVLGVLEVNVWFALMLLVYGLVSKMYSHPSVRLKKYPIGGWVVAGFFQGFFTFLMCYIGINNFDFENIMQARLLIPATLTSVMLWGNYPMTQVYQHDEDGKRNDQTLSMLLGIRGTFLFVQVVFGLAMLGFVFFFKASYSIFYGYIFLGALVPVVGFFMYWFYRVWHDESQANFTNTMWLNFISATCLNGFFVYLFLAIRHIGQYF